MADSSIRRVIEIDAKIGGEALAQLRQLQQLTKGGEDSLQALQKVATALSGGFGTLTAAQARFAAGLQQQLRSVTEARQALGQYQSSELGVVDATDELIKTLVGAGKAAADKATADREGVAATNSAATAESARAASSASFVSSLVQQQDAIGKTAGQFSQMQAAILATLTSYDAFRAKTQQLAVAQTAAIESARALVAAEGLVSAEQLRATAAGQALIGITQQVVAGEREQLAVAGRLADVNAELARSEAEAAAADQAHSQAGQTLLESLRAQNVALRERATLGAGGALSQDVQTQIQGNQSGVGNQVAIELAQRRELLPIVAQIADAERDLARAETEAEAAERKHSEAGQTFLATLRAENEALAERFRLGGRAPTEDESLQSQANGSGVTADANAQLAIRRELQAANAILAESNREVARTEAENEEADRKHSAAGQALLATLREQNAVLAERATLGRSPTADEQLQTQGNNLGVGTQIAEEIARKQDLASIDAIIADKRREEIRNETDAAAADQKHSDSIQGLIASLREQAAAANSVNLTQSQKDTNQAETLGAGPQIAPFIAARDVAVAEAAAKRESAAADEEKAKTSASVQSSLQKEIDLFGKDRLAILEHQSAIRGDTAATAPLIAEIRQLEAEQKADADATRQANVAKNEGANVAKNLKAQQDAFERSLKDTIATYGLTGAALQKYRAQQLGLGQDILDTIDKQKKLLDSSAHAAGGFSGVSRELLVLAHEASQDQFKRLAGSVIVLGEQMNALKYLTTAAGASIAGLVVGVGLLGAAFILGSFQQNEFDRSLILTNNFSGQTNDSLHKLASTIASSADVTIGKASEITQALVSTGKFGPTSIGAVGLAVADLSRVSHRSADEVVKDFTSMADGVANWAKRSNEQYHFLDTTTFAYIQTLELQGKTEQAMVVASDALHDSLGKQAESVGTLGRSYRELQQTLSNVIHYFEDIGKTKTTGQLIADTQKKRDEAVAQRDALVKGQSDAAFQNQGVGANLETGSSSNSRLVSDTKESDAQIALIDQQLDLLKKEEARQNELATNKSIYDRRQLDGIKGDTEVNQQLATARGGDRADVKIAAFKKSIQQQRDANDALKELNKVAREYTNDPALLANNPDKFIPGDDIVAKQIQEIRDRDKPRKVARTDLEKSQDKLDNTADKRLADLGRETVALQHQIDVYKNFPELVDKAASAKLQFDLAEGNLVGKNGATLDDNQKQALIAAAAKQDATAREFAGAKEAATAEKRIKQIQDEGDAQAKNARETQIATETASLGASIEIGKRQQLIELIKQAVNARADSALQRKLTADAASADDEVKQLQTEIDLLGLSTIERQKRTTAIKLEAEARKLIVDNPDKADVINTAAADNIAKINAQQQALFDTQRAFSTGAKVSFQAYADDASDAAKFSSKFINDGLNGLTDALSTFYQTGKFSLSKFLSSLAADFTNQIAKLQIKSLLDDQSVKGGIDKALAYLEQTLFPAIAKATQTIDGISIPTSSTPAVGATAVNDVQANFRSSEIASQNASAGVASAAGAATETASTTAATTAATTALTTFTTAGVTPAATGLTSLLGVGIAPTETGLTTLATVGVLPAQEGFIGVVGALSGAVAGLYDFTAALQAAAAQAGGDGGGAGLLGGLFSGGSSGGSTFTSGGGSGGAVAGSVYGSFALGGIASHYMLPSFAMGGGFGSRGVLNLPTFAQGGVYSPRGARPLAAFASGGIMTEFGSLRPEYYSDGGGITDRPRLAVFGEGRKPEAYVPLDDGKNMQVTVKVGPDGKQSAHVALPSGKYIPVKFNNAPSNQPLQSYSHGGVHSQHGGTALAYYSTGGISDDEKNVYSSYAYGGVGGSHIQYFAQGGTTNDIAYYGLPQARIALPDGTVAPIVVKHEHGTATPYVITPNGAKLPASLLSLDVLHGSTGIAGAAGPGGFGGLAGATGDAGADALPGLAGNVAKTRLGIGGLAATQGLSTPAGAGGFEGLASAVGLTSFANRPSEAVRALSRSIGPAADPRIAASAANVTAQPDYRSERVQEADKLLHRNKFASFAEGGIFVGDFGSAVLQKFSKGGSVTDKPTLALFGEGRGKEANIPMDGDAIGVTVRNTVNGIQAYAPLPNGGSIPVSVKTDGFMHVPDSQQYRFGGYAYQAFATGGIASGTSSGAGTSSGFDSVPLVRGQTLNGTSTTGTSGSEAAGGKGPKTTVNIHNHGEPISGESQETEAPNGDKTIEFIINAAHSRVNDSIARGGSTHAVLKSKGVSLSNGLARRG